MFPGGIEVEYCLKMDYEITKMDYKIRLWLKKYAPREVLSLMRKFYS